MPEKTSDWAIETMRREKDRYLKRLLDQMDKTAAILDKVLELDARVTGLEQMITGAQHSSRQRSKNSALTPQPEQVQP